jgi:hypothetical protein
LLARGESIGAVATLLSVRRACQVFFSIGNCLKLLIGQTS